MSERQIGYVLLGGGIFVMFVAFVIVVLLFTGIIQPVKLFSIPAPSFDTGNLMPEIPGIPQAAGEKVEIIPTDAFNRILNIGIQFLLMTFTMSFGFKIANLGVKLVRPIKIEAKP